MSVFESKIAGTAGLSGRLSIARLPQYIEGIHVKTSAISKSPYNKNFQLGG